MQVRVGGRMMFKRVMGKASFAKLADRSGAIQLFLQESTLGAAYEAFKDYDVGDILGARGPLFRTKTGELSVRVTGLKLLAKSLRPLPDKWHGLSDTETRYRMRYVDLRDERGQPRGVPHPQRHRPVSARCARRARLPRSRDADDAADSRAARRRGRSSRTTTRSISEMYLRIAPELYLKRLIVGGLERVYEINRNFRNEGLSTQHNPEFTMLELYWAYSDYRELMELIERLLHGLADSLLGTRVVRYQGRDYDLGKPFRRVTVEELIIEHNPDLDRSAAARCGRTCAAPASGSASRSSRAMARASCRSRFSRRPASIT